MGRYGVEFGNAFADPEIGRFGEGDFVTRAFTDFYLSAGANPFTMYLSRRNYLLASSVPIRIPANIALKFDAGGRIVLAARTVLVIEGAIDAGPFQIFELLGADANRAVVRIESRLMERVHPEWWGATALRNQSEDQIVAGTRRDSRLALQDCLRTACTERALATPPLPPLTVVCSRYATAASIHVDASRPAHLWLDGASDPMGARATTPTLLYDPVANIERGSEEATLVLGPTVSAELRNVGFKYLDRNNINAIRSQEPAGAVLAWTDSNAPAWKGLRFSRCGFDGGRDYVVRIREIEAPPNDFRPKVAPSRRYRFQQCYFWVRYTLRASSRFGLDVGLRLGGLVDLSTCFLREDLDNGQPLPTELDYRAGLRLQGGSCLARASTFHTDLGPRPSLGDPTSGPDGQDIWVDSNGTEPRTHLTALHIESQSWWFLGAAPDEAAAVAGNVVLLNVGAENVNWLPRYLPAASPEVRAVQPTGTLSMRPGSDNATIHPPSVMWSGGPNRLVLVGCRFLRYVTSPKTSAVWDIGTAFKMPGSSLPTTPLGGLRWVTPDVIPRPSMRVSEMPTLPSNGMWNGISRTPAVFGLHLVTRGI